MLSGSESDGLASSSTAALQADDTGSGLSPGYLKSVSALTGGAVDPAAAPE